MCPAGRPIRCRTLHIVCDSHPRWYRQYPLHPGFNTDLNVNASGIVQHKARYRVWLVLSLSRCSNAGRTIVLSVKTLRLLKV